MKYRGVMSTFRMQTTMLWWPMSIRWRKSLLADICSFLSMCWTIHSLCFLNKMLRYHNVKSGNFQWNGLFAWSMFIQWSNCRFVILTKFQGTCDYGCYIRSWTVHKKLANSGQKLPLLSAIVFLISFKKPLPKKVPLSDLRIANDK